MCNFKITKWVYTMGDKGYRVILSSVCTILTLAEIWLNTYAECTSYKAFSIVDRVLANCSSLTLLNLIRRY